MVLDMKQWTHQDLPEMVCRALERRPSWRSELAPCLQKKRHSFLCTLSALTTAFDISTKYLKYEERQCQGLLRVKEKHILNDTPQTGGCEKHPVQGAWLRKACFNLHQTTSSAAEFSTSARSPRLILPLRKRLMPSHSHTPATFALLWADNLSQSRNKPENWHLHKHHHTTPAIFFTTYTFSEWSVLAAVSLCVWAALSQSDSCFDKQTSLCWAAFITQEEEVSACSERESCEFLLPHLDFAVHSHHKTY